MLDEFKDNKNLVRMSPFLVATAMGKADGVFLEEEKVFELSHFEEFSLHSEEFTSRADIFLDLENEDFHHIWELEVEEILSALKELPVARSDGEVHDLEIMIAGELEVIFDSIRDDTSNIQKSNFKDSPYDITDLESVELKDSIKEHNTADTDED